MANDYGPEQYVILEAMTDEEYEQWQTSSLTPEEWRFLADDKSCEWFARCENRATHFEPHPILRAVPCCDRCAALVARVLL